MSGEPAEATPAVVVVGSRFCAPAATAFAVTKTISVTGRDFTVTDAHGAAVMQVEAAVFSFLQHRSLLLDAASRRPVLTLQDSTYLASTRWEAYRGDSTSRRNLLFVAVKTAPVQLARTKVRLFLAGNGSGERVPDFVIGVCTVSAGGGGGGGRLRWQHRRADQPPEHGRRRVPREAHVYREDQPRRRPGVHPRAHRDSRPDASLALELAIDQSPQLRL
uniref:Protein LURP-one-related 15 n=1 Tax=Aegilops tauschii TaxID=37682 RepID=M8C2R9_AEGTA